MAKKQIKLPGFGIGLLIGSFVTALYFKKKYDEITVHIDRTKADECPDFVETKTCNCDRDCSDTDADCDECPCSNCDSSSCDSCSVK